MGEKHFTEEQIAFALRQADSGTSVAEAIRKFAISEQAFYRWRKRFVRLGVPDLRRLRILEESAGIRPIKFPLPEQTELAGRASCSTPPTGQTNENWSIDFMTDQLVGSQRSGC